MIILVLNTWGIVREGLSRVLTLELGESTELLIPKDTSQAERWVSMYSPKLALVNPLAYPGSVSALAVHIPVIVYTESVDPSEVAQALQGGASGWVNIQDDPGELVSAIDSVCQGVPTLAVKHVTSVVSRLTRIHQEYLRAPTRLSCQELRVLRYMSQGLTDTEISQEMVCSPRTVSNTVGRVYVKLGVRNRVEATLRALEAGLVNPGTHTYKGDE